MSDIEKHILIAAPIQQVWAALTDPTAISAWMGDDSVQADLQINGSYQFFGGETTGRFPYIDAPHILEFTWRQSTWHKDWADSLVHWQLQSDGDNTRLHLIHSQFPNQDERDSHDEGWEIYWLEPMQAWLEAAV